MDKIVHFREEGDYPKGAVVVIDKPLNWTSFDVVNKIRICLRKRCGKIKVGHAGTLDPLATGVVILCIGRATKEIEKYMAEEKEYVAEITFGHTTPSYDLETSFDGQFSFDHINQATLEEVITQFQGDIIQQPPVFSAVRVDGVRAYEKARNGDKVTMQARKVAIREIEILEVNLPVVKIRVVCSKGTYIRSLAHDIGKACNSGAYLSALRRIRVGDFQIEEAHKIEDVIHFLQDEE